MKDVTPYEMISKIIRTKQLQIVGWSLLALLLIVGICASFTIWTDSKLGAILSIVFGLLSIASLIFTIVITVSTFSDPEDMLDHFSIKRKTFEIIVFMLSDNDVRTFQKYIKEYGLNYKALSLLNKSIHLKYQCYDIIDRKLNQ